ncbi:hypothetical protein KIW84_035910 [Lathyrus oleraceus]|uniref:Uncharacterized protein n=3 Tax=Pisum sativum TaxID=3888 RepID=A0A9D4Y2V6_PEA|nr:hypothetical protein KIW84_035910 [Pisum sativum]
MEEEEEEKGDLGKDNDVTNVEFGVSISDPKGKNVVMNSETQNNGIEDDWDVEVDIIGNSGFKGVENSCMDLAVVESSSSSSYGDACPGSALTDSDEAESSIRDERSKGLPRLRKRKMTDHWKKFIFPIKQRCKWLEIQLRKLDSQAKKYEEAIAAYDQQKQLRFLMPAGDVLHIKSVPKSDGIKRNEVMMRKKRKRVEECDLSTYMSNHCLFSYYENKNRDHDVPVEDSRNDVTSDVDNAEEFKLNDTRSSVDHRKDTDKSFLELIEKIEELSSQVENLKTRINTVITENPGKFSSITQSNTIGPSRNNSELCEEDQPWMDNPLSTGEGITPSIEAAITTQFEVPGEAKGESEELVEEQKPISLAQASDSDMVTENVVPSIRSVKPCSTLRSPFPKNTRTVRKRSGQ